MRLSTADLQYLGRMFYQNFAQIPSSNAIMVQSDTHVLKLPMWHNDSRALNMVLDMVLDRTLRTLTNSQNVSNCVIQLTEQMVGAAGFFMYTRVYYNPMNCVEARRCLKDFYCSVCNSLHQLHNILQLAHFGCPSRQYMF